MPSFSHFPKTSPPPDFVGNLISVFTKHSPAIGTEGLEKGLESDHVLQILRSDLEAEGFQVERGKKKAEKILRPVFFGENGVASHTYEVDAYHSTHRCGLEVEAGRAWKGNAIYRDLVLSLMMVDVDFLVVAVPVAYKHFVNGRLTVSPDYRNATDLANSLYGQRRFALPYELTIIGY